MKVDLKNLRKFWIAAWMLLKFQNFNFCIKRLRIPRKLVEFQKVRSQVSDDTYGCFDCGNLTGWVYQPFAIYLLLLTFFIFGKVWLVKARLNWDMSLMPISVFCFYLYFTVIIVLASVIFVGIGHWSKTIRDKNSLI